MDIVEEESDLHSESDGGILDVNWDGDHGAVKRGPTGY
jgi:hypothetical protein